MMSEEIGELGAFSTGISRWTLDLVLIQAKAAPVRQPESTLGITIRKRENSKHEILCIHA
jgi:hypothetical protein